MSDMLDMPKSKEPEDEGQDVDQEAPTALDALERAKGLAETEEKRHQVKPRQARIIVSQTSKKSIKHGADFTISYTNCGIYHFDALHVYLFHKTCNK